MDLGQRRVIDSQELALSERGIRQRSEQIEECTNAKAPADGSDTGHGGMEDRSEKERESRSVEKRSRAIRLDVERTPCRLHHIGAAGL